MGVKITAAYLRQQQKAGKIKGFAEARPAISSIKKTKRKRQVSAGILWMKDVLREMNVQYVEEHTFHPDRGWRFDLALLPVECKVAIEYDGIHSEKSRHTTKDGFSEDLVKMNAAQQLGWRVFRYTKMNLHQFKQDIQTIITNPIL